MKAFYSIFLLMMTNSILFADQSSPDRLLPYKEYLDHWTDEGVDWSSFPRRPKSRYETFKTAFESITKDRPIIVELGTARSFVHGGCIGCNSDDPAYWNPDAPENWDWGAGFFTRMATISLAHQTPEIHTIDIMKSHINRCKIMTEDYKHLITYHVISSLDYLQTCQFPNGIDLLYLDTGDMTPIEPTAQLQLAEAKIIVERNLIAQNGLLLIDDVRNQTPKKFGDTSGLGKSKYALPYLLNHGFEIVMDEYQVLLRKK